MAGRFGPRFGLEAAFLIAVAVILGLLEVTWPAIVAAMAIAWLLVAAVEVALSRERPAPEPEAVTPPVPEAEPAEGFRIVARGEEEELFVAPAVEAPAPPDEAELPSAAAAAQERIEAEEPAEEPEEVPEQVVPEPVPAVPAEELPPPPPPPVLEAVPTAPEPEPEREREPEPEPEPEVVELRPEAPREWNLWELERAVRDHAGEDPIREEELSFLLIYLREFASPDGQLPRDFDGLVRESFGDLLRTAR